jgi:signal transduction histidine kinase
LIHARRVLRDHLSEAAVLVSLCSLLGISYYQLRAIHASLVNINEVIEPATRAASDLQFALSREAASTRAYLLTRNAAYHAEFHEARAARRDALRRLSTLSAGVLSGIEVVVAEEEAQLAVADRRLDALHAETLTPEAYLVDFPDQHRRFSTVIARAATLHQQLRDRATAERREIEATERFGLMLEIVSLALAAIGGIAVVALKSREHAARVASETAQAEADRRRVQLETMTTRWMRLIRGFTHDLKNPLNAANGYLFMLEQGVIEPLSPGQLKAVGNAVTACSRRLRSPWIWWTWRAETADVDIRPVPLDLCDLVATVVDDYRAYASAKGLALVTALPPLAETVDSDPARVSQILGNLVSNAVKYTDAGTIAVSVQHRSDSAGRSGVAVDVSDTGRGIPVEDQRRIFNEFEQVDHGAPTGTGIGLAISERLAHTLGGAITLHSEEGKGSTFTLWLPLAR